MRDWLKITPVWLCLALALVLLIDCSQERGTEQPGGSAVSGGRAATGAPTDPNGGRTSAYISGVSARMTDRSAADLPGKQAEVRMTNSLKYVPEEVTISIGQTIVWTNTSSQFHTVTDDPALAQDRSHAQLPAGAQPFNSGNIAPGEVFQRMFDVPGTYVYFCIPHEAMGMVGKITVQKK